MSAQPRFEIVRTLATQPFHARFRAANGRVVWVTENFTRRASALNAIYSISAAIHGTAADPENIRDIDERGGTR